MTFKQQIESTLYFIIGSLVIAVLVFSIVGSSDQVIIVLQYLPASLPVLLILAGLRWYVDRATPPKMLVAQTWFKVTVATAVLIAGLAALLRTCC